jgi:hypothetical protein
MWLAGSVAAIVGLVVVVAALVLDPRSPPPAASRPLGPDLPPPERLRALRFPSTLRGYDPRFVDARLAEIVDWYEHLYRCAAAPPEPAASEGPRQPAEPDGSEGPRGV